MKEIELDVATVGGISEMAVELHMPVIVQMVKRYNNGSVKLDETDLPIIVDYLDATASYLKSKYPNYDDEEPGYDEQDEDMYFDSLEIYCNPLKMAVAAKFGDDFLARYRR
jgi:hypothetical protein